MLRRDAEYPLGNNFAPLALRRDAEYPLGNNFARWRFDATAEYPLGNNFAPLALRRDAEYPLGNNFAPLAHVPTAAARVCAGQTGPSARRGCSPAQVHDQHAIMTAITLTARS